LKYFKNTELARLYNVSEKSVRNWVEATQDGKLSLQLYEEAGRAYVANTSKNTLLIETLAEKGKKYRNGRGHKSVIPSRTFYELYDPKQIIDIVSNIDVYREIPYQYSYFGEGASHWNLYTEKLLQEESPNYLTDILELLESNAEHIDGLLSTFDRVNVVDLGIGNCLPVRYFLQHLIEKNKLSRYIGIDISSDMLQIAERNIRKWFGESVRFEGYVRDLNYDRFEDLIAMDSFGESAETTCNVVLFFGSTIVNMREPNLSLQTIHSSMGKKDLLFFTLKLDSEKSRRYFDFTTAMQTVADKFRGKDLLNSLSIKEDFYELEQFFDEKELVRKTSVRLKVALSIEFMVGGKKRVVELNKGDSILLWRARHQGLLETMQQLDQAGFELLTATRSKDEEHLLSISKLKAKT